MKTMYLVVGNPGARVGLFATREAARIDHAVNCRCKAVVQMSLEESLKLTKRKKLTRGIHRVRFVIEPNEGRMS